MPPVPPPQSTGFRLSSHPQCSSDSLSPPCVCVPPCRQSEYGGVVFGGWARMAQTITAFSIVEVAKPKIGEGWPARVRADVTVNLNVQDHIKHEWEGKLADWLILSYCIFSSSSTLLICFYFIQTAQRFSNALIFKCSALFLFPRDCFYSLQQFTAPIKSFPLLSASMLQGRDLYLPHISVETCYSRVAQHFLSVFVLWLWWSEFREPT